jgi:beta-mannosidase
MELDLTTSKWALMGWVPNAWAWALAQGQDPTAATTDWRRYQCTPLITAQLPGSVQDDLLRAKLLPDWNVGLNAAQCEWVEHRHWEYRTEVTVPADWEEQRILLRAEGLDYAGSIVVDGRQVATFRGMLMPHEFDLTPCLTPGQTHRLSIFITGAPPEQGQLGFTSRSRFFKARFAYGWDWCPRLVPLGIWDKLTLRTAGPTRLRGCLPRAAFDVSAWRGLLNLLLDVETPAPLACQCRVRLSAADHLVGEYAVPVSFAPGRSETEVRLDRPLRVDPWWPSGWGDQVLYDLEVRLEGAGGAVLEQWSGRVGFKQVRWLPCEGAPANAEPWLCEVNGKKVFLQGVNWTPVRMTYGSVTRAMYAQRLKLYADLGLNILRVWGGAMLEKEDFYTLCDELGLMVWQEFPLSSSGADNVPPDDPAVLAELREIVSSYVWRRGGHVAHLLWSGGNELTQADARNTPANPAHPAIALMAGVALRLTPGKRFISTSPSGPSFSYDPATANQGLHHDVHGPWDLPGTREEWQAHWEGHDGLLVSEVGAPSCSSLKVLKRYAGRLDLWPPSLDNPSWQYRTPWWIQWPRLSQAEGFTAAQEELERYVQASQEEQAWALGVMVASCRKRFPRCGGVILWMGHDCYPCPSNTSIVDFDGQPKLAVATLREVFRSA